MPKIRGIKPEFWTDEDVVEMSLAARLLFIGMWNFACDNGHLPDKPKQIKMRVLPFDDVDAEALLAELEDNGRIERADGTVTILKFAHHQKPHRRWWTCCELPDCTVPNDAPPQGRNGGEPAPQPLRNGGATVAHGGATADVDGDGDCERDGEGEKPKSSRKRSTTLPDDFVPNETNQRLAEERNLNLDAVVDQWRDHHLAKGSTFIDWQRALSTWIRRERPQSAAPTPVRHLPRAHEIEHAPPGMTDAEYDAWERAQRERRRA